MLPLSPTSLTQRLSVSGQRLVADRALATIVGFAAGSIATRRAAEAVPAALKLAA